MAVIDYSALTSYVNQLSKDIQTAAILKSKFVSEINSVGGVKYATVVNGFNHTLKTTAPSCGTLMTGTGSLTPYQNQLTVTDFEIPENLCITDFEDKYLGMFSMKGSYNEDVTPIFGTKWVESTIAEAQKTREIDLICGSTTGTFSSTATTRMNGLLYDLLVTNSASINLVATASAYNKSTSVAIVENIILSRDIDLIDKDDVYLWLSPADYITLCAGLRAANNFYFTGIEGNGNFKFPGTNINISLLAGLRGANPASSKHFFILAQGSNIFHGYDDVNDINNFRLKYETVVDQLQMKMRYKAGIVCANYGEITVGTSL
jgi:hypothetical protein